MPGGIEAGLLGPTERFLAVSVETFPQLQWLDRFYHGSRTWGDGPFPRWFEDWLNIERAATSLRIWQPIPASTGAHAGLGGAFMVATADGKPDVMHAEGVEGQTIERNAVVRKAAVASDRVRSDALACNTSRDLS